MTQDGLVFFDDHPEFLETSSTANSISRLNLRHLAMIEAHADVLRGRSVIDIASHDGRWSFAALEAGASSVLGIEGRPELIANAYKTFAAKGVPDDRYRFVEGDVHERLFDADVKADVVLCLGFLYHTARYVELIAGIASTGAEYVILDTRVLQDAPGPMVQMQVEATAAQSLAIKDKFALGNHVISALPSEEALALMLGAAGYEIDHKTDWRQLIQQRLPEAKGVGTYKRGFRVTMRAKRRSA